MKRTRRRRGNIAGVVLALAVVVFAGGQVVRADEMPPDPAPGGASVGVSAGTISYGNECSGCGGNNLITEVPPYKEETVETVMNEGGLINIQGSPHCTPLGGSPEEQAAAGAGGLMIDGFNGDEICEWVCDEERITFGYSDGKWGINSVSTNLAFNQNLSDETGFNFSQVMSSGNTMGWVSSVADNGLSSTGLPLCGEWTGESTRTTVEEICWKELIINGGASVTPGSTAGSGSFVCAGDYDVKASASIPCPAVQRWPYPRGIVNAPNEFLISSNGSAVSDDSRNWCEPDVMNYTITVGWEQLPIPPLWHWDERPWTTQPLSTMGYHVFHTYDTASFEKPENGPNVRGEMDHPAYQVKVETYWIPWVEESWDEWEYAEWDCDRVVVGQQYNPTTGAWEDAREWQGPECAQRLQCLNRGIEPYPNRSACGEWREKGSGRITVDLLEFGFPAPYVMFFDAEDVTQPPPGLPDPQPRRCELPVPVIESQGLLTDPNTP